MSDRQLWTPTQHKQLCQSLLEIAYECLRGHGHFYPSMHYVTADGEVHVESIDPAVLYCSNQIITTTFNRIAAGCQAVCVSRSLIPPNSDKTMIVVGYFKRGIDWIYSAEYAQVAGGTVIQPWKLTNYRAPVGKGRCTFSLVEATKLALN